MKKILLSLLLLSSASGSAYAKELLNVSYDPTRELYAEYNQEFTKYWKEKTGEDIDIKQSHGGSGKQSRSIIDGLDADVATLALGYDVDALYKNGKLINQNWKEQLPNHSVPYYSTIVFVVRKGNPKKILDWNDLAKDNVKVITPNPKTSGGARWNYLAILAYAKENHLDGHLLLKQIYKNVPVLDSGARGSTLTFAQRGIGDVLLAWENEAALVKKQFPDSEIVIPSISILAEPPVAVVEKNANKKGNAKVAHAYLEYLYSDVGQNIIAKNSYRPFNKAIAQKYNFPSIKLVSIDEFGGWDKVQQENFNDGGYFDQLYN